MATSRSSLRIPTTSDGCCRSSTSPRGSYRSDVSLKLRYYRIRQRSRHRRLLAYLDRRSDGSFCASGVLALRAQGIRGYLGDSTLVAPSDRVQARTLLGAGRWARTGPYGTISVPAMIERQTRQIYRSVRSEKCAVARNVYAKLPADGQARDAPNTAFAATFWPSFDRRIPVAPTRLDDSGCAKSIDASTNPASPADASTSTRCCGMSPCSVHLLCTWRSNLAIGAPTSAL